MLHFSFLEELGFCTGGGKLGRHTNNYYLQAEKKHSLTECLHFCCCFFVLKKSKKATTLQSV